jgi:hypothetical protein
MRVVGWPKPHDLKAKVFLSGEKEKTMISGMERLRA